MVPGSPTESLRKLQELDRLEVPGWLYESEQLRNHVIDRLVELKDMGLLGNALELHCWLSELANATFQALDFSRKTDQPKPKGVLLRELWEDVRRDQQIKKRRNLHGLELLWKKHLDPVFGEKAASEIRQESLFLFTQHRLEQGAAPGTINRELACLRRIYRLALRNGRIRPSQQLFFNMLEEDNVREGFVKDEEYEALARETAKIGLWLRTMFELGYTYGWRKSELLNLKVGQLDFTDRTIRLEGRQTKTKRPRLVVMTPGVADLLTQCAAGKSAEDFLFTRRFRSRGLLFKYRGQSRFWWIRYRDLEGKLIAESCKTEDKAEALRMLESRAKPVSRAGRVWTRSFEKDWNAVRNAAGVPWLLFHDLRRTAVRNMIRAGIPEKVAMTISGHLTRAIFDRYHIVSEDELADAALKMQAFAELRQQKNGAA
jgi:integrase